MISTSTWAQYILDIFPTVSALEWEEFQMQTVILPTGNAANMHLVISDASGDSAIFEYVKGKLLIHHGKKFRAMTNSPTYDTQSAIQEYWKDVGSRLCSASSQLG